MSKDIQEYLTSLHMAGTPTRWDCISALMTVFLIDRSDAEFELQWWYRGQLK